MILKRSSDRRKYIPIEVVLNATCILLALVALAWGVLIHNNIRETRQIQAQLTTTVVSIQKDTTEIKETFNNKLESMNNNLDARLTAMQRTVDKICPQSGSVLPHSNLLSRNE